MTEADLEIIPEDIMTSRVVPPEMVRDLLVVAHLDGEMAACIAKRLRTVQGIASHDGIIEAIRACLGDSADDDANSIARTLLNIERDDTDRVLRTLDRWRKSTTERTRIFGDALFAGFDRNLQILLADNPCVALLRKANQLLRDVGNEFKSVAYFCDLRPVFDESRENVLGFVTLANMRLIYVRQDGERRACEVALTEPELTELVEGGKKALAKLEVLKKASTQLASRADDRPGLPSP